MKYYINKDGNYCSYDYIPSFTEADGMTEISAEEYNGYVVAKQKEYEEYVAEQANESDYIASLERFGVE